MAAQYNFTILLIGNSAVGKTEIRRRMLDRSFKEAFIASTAGDAAKHIFEKKEVTLLGKRMALTVIDAPGQEVHWNTLARKIRNVNCSIIVCDLSKHKTIDDIGRWARSLDKVKGAPKASILVGNKADLGKLPTYKQAVSANIETIKDIAKRNGMQCFITSAKTGENVEEMFEAAIKSLVSGVETAKQQVNISGRKELLGKIENAFKKTYGSGGYTDDIIKTQKRMAKVDRDNPTVEQLRTLVSRLAKSFGTTGDDRRKCEKFKRYCENLFNK